MKVTINSRYKRILLKWLKNGEMTLNDTPDIYNGLSEWGKLLLGDDRVVALDREGKIIVIKWLQSGSIDTEDIDKMFPTFMDMLMQAE